MAMQLLKASLYYISTSLGPLGPRFALALALAEEELVNSLEEDLVFPPGEVPIG